MISRRDCWELLNYTYSKRRGARYIEVFLVTLIILNVLAVALETVGPLYARYKTQFDCFDLFSVLIFTLEYVLRIWTAVEFPPEPGEEGLSPAQRRWRLARQPLMILDLLAIVPFYLSLLIPIDLRFLRVLRLLRIFKLTRYSYAMTMLIEVIQEETDSFIAGVFILMVLLVLASSGAYLAEHAAQPDKFGSIPEAMWWAVATLTTVGYGDVTPVTPLGRFFGAMIMVLGIGMAALPAGIIANGMSDHLTHRREDLRRQFRKALQDGVIDPDEEAELERLRLSLGIGQLDAQNIRRDMLEKHPPVHLCRCPDCGTVFDSRVGEAAFNDPPPKE